MSALFEIKAQANEQMLATIASELFVQKYRLLLDQFAAEAFNKDGEAYKKVYDAWHMKLHSDKTVIILESTAQQAIDAKVREASRHIGHGEEYEKELSNQVTQTVFQHQQVVLEKLVDEYFQPGGPARKIIEDQFKVKMQGQTLLRAIDTATNAHIDNSANKTVFAFVTESESMIKEQIAPLVEDAILALVEKFDYKKLIEEKFDSVIEKLVFEAALDQARAGIGEAVHEEVMRKLPHAAVPYVGRVIDQLPYEAVLRHYIKNNSMAMMTDVLVKLSKGLLEKRFKPLVESGLNHLDAGSFEMPEVVITPTPNQTTITIHHPEQR